MRNEAGRLVPPSMLAALDVVADEVARRLGGDLPGVAQIFRAALRNTLETTVVLHDDGTVYVRTGDIPAMWLRDSAAQVRPYLLLARQHEEFADLLVGVVRRQWRYICHDPYANAFNEAADGATWDPQDRTAMTPLVWERKYELDSLCAPLVLAAQVYAVTGRTDHLGAEFWAASRRILDTWDAELDHERTSTYRFQRTGEGLAREGLGSPTAPNGMMWSGFRPSDDPCQLHYLVPANAFAAVAAEQLAILSEVSHEPDAGLASRARAHAQRLRSAVWEHGTVDHPTYGRVYAYEVDGLGNYVLMDEANVPSLLSLPYLGWCAPDDETYLATRRLALSQDNPYFYVGRAARGIGSPHNGEGPFIWPIALAMQALTTTDPFERRDLLHSLAATDAGTGLIHEEFHADDPTDFTRPWFAWANSLFAEAVLLHAGMPVPTQLPSPAEVA